MKYGSVFKDKAILVYTLGKVGSATFYNELKRISPFNNVFHVHFLSDEWLKKRLLNTNHLENIVNAANNIFDFLKKNSQSRKYIITLVREPVSRQLSNFMQNSFDYVEGDIKEYSADELKEIYLSKMSYEFTLNWFDTEFKNYTGVDIYSTPFDKEKGYSIIEEKDFHILVVKLEKLNDCYTEALREFLGVDLALLGNTNEGETKDISEIYKDLKRMIKFSEEELNEVYAKKYVQHFYTQEEIKTFTRKHSS